MLNMVIKFGIAIYRSVEQCLRRMLMLRQLMRSRVASTKGGFVRWTFLQTVYKSYQLHDTSKDNFLDHWLSGAAAHGQLHV